MQHSSWHALIKEQLPEGYFGKINHFMQQVYADKRLGYNQNKKFAIPAKFNPCETADTININGIQEEYF